ncbi:DNA primase [Prevotella melaninogenica]|uniref:DNA primase n=2 Tax=Prevotella TaxID=838 RepID=A0A7D4KGM7_9BACT|nr:DNA primase [Prevotella melaninogenica]QKH89238.1 DNA primase [Prevotella melaninogenica]
MIDRPTVDRIMNASNIVEVVSDFVSLRKTGTSYKGLCPFHDDRTPSFSVSPVKGVYKCFSCGAAGNAVKFIMEHEQMTYPEALKWLANKYHIEVHERELTNEEKQQENERESMFLVNEWAAKYFNDILHNDVDGMAIGMQYFRSRGFRDDIIRKFQLGFCLSSRHAFADAALKAGFQRDFLIKTGLCFERENGELIDRFNGRVMFPWVSVSGKVTAFGGRLLDSRTKGVSQKYVNSPDSVIYHKERELYGIFQAKKAIAKHDLVYMVEGYTDVVSMHQCGIENVVANSGTALSVHQIRLLRRFTSNIVLLYDGDEAGQHAALRGTDMLLAEGMNVKVLLLPDGKDPDEFARSYSADDFRKYIEDNQTDFIVFKINVLLKGVTDPIKRSEAVGSIVQSISVIKDPILRDTYIRECANRTGVSERTLMEQMNRNIYSNREQQTREQQTREQQQHRTVVIEEQQREEEVDTSTQLASKVEEMLIQAVIKDGEKVIFRDVKDENSGETYNLTVAQYIAYDLGSDNLGFSNELYTKILQEAVEHCGEEGFKAEEYFTQHADINIASVAVRLSVDRFQLAESLQVKETEQTLRDRVIHLVADFRLEYVSSHLKELNERLLQVKDPQEMQEVMSEIMRTQNLRNELAKKTGGNILV